jgi:hypothetical protein
MSGSFYSLREFLESVEDKSYLDILRETRRQGTAAERASFRVRGAVEARNGGSMAFAECLKGLVFLLENHIRPAGVHDHDFELFRPLCEKLVAKGQLPSSILTLFAHNPPKELP